MAAGPFGTATWVFIGMVAATLGLTFVVARVRRRRFVVLPPQHVAAAALVGVIGWEGAVNLPGLISQTNLLYTGLAGAPGETAAKLFAVAYAAFVTGCFVAIAGVIRRHPWGAALGTGCAVTRIAIAAYGVVQVLGFSRPQDQVVSFIVPVVAQAVPPLVAIALFAWPFRGGGLPLWDGPSRADAGIDGSAVGEEA
jgi:hypothetical protein